MLALVRQAFEGRYEVEREIGKGGNARIFLAREPGGQPVALKILHPELLVSVAADRFLREIKLASQLDHPHIAHLLDSGERDWLVYYVMTYVEGATLRELLDAARAGSRSPTRSGWPTTCSTPWSTPTATASSIGTSSRRTWSSRPQGAVLLDFGIARAVWASGSDRLTRSGIAVGTSTYMSPEQITALQEIDLRSDLYSLACVLFECLAGQPPFVHRNEAVVLQMHLTQPAPDLRTHPAGDPGGARRRHRPGAGQDPGGALADRRGHARRARRGAGGVSRAPLLAR